MATLKDLVRDLDRALDSNHEANAAAVRQTIAKAYPETPEGAEANYKLGLLTLYRKQDLDEAANFFRESTKAKQKTWSHCARTSLGLVLLRQGKHQQAIFELRRAASPRPPNILVAQACGMLVLALTELGNKSDAARARVQHLEVLAMLMKHEDPETAALAQFMRGMEHKFDGQRDPAKALLTQAIASGLLQAEDHAAAEKALAVL